MQLFEFTNMLFTKPEEYSNISSQEKRKHFFMVNRFMGIQHPLQANLLGHIKINQTVVIDFWQRFVIKQYKKRIPFWMYTKGAKKIKESEEQKLTVSKDLIAKYAKLHGYEIKTVYSALNMFPEKTKKEIKEFEKTIKD